MSANLASKKCIPCEAGTPAMSRREAVKLLEEISGWELVDVGSSLKIRKSFKFASYMEGIDFVDKVARVAEQEGHHPNLEVGYAKVAVNLWTHAIGGLSENDFILAAKIDNLQREHERSEAK